MTVLEVKNLTTEFDTEFGKLQAVRDVSFELQQGEILGIVGESGSGKSQTMYSIMGLLAQNGAVKSGEIWFEGRNISTAGLDEKAMKENEKYMRTVRGKKISMIFQDPLTFLNPVLKIGTQIMEPLLLHEKMNKQQARQRAIELMGLVGIPSPADRLKQYPHQFSGGMRQRIIIAIALACNPQIVIADEPTTALDVTIQAQVLEIIKKLTSESKTSVILITHDLGVVASMCDRILIMYGGKVMERGTDEEIFYNAKHPYTQGLLSSINNPDAEVREKLHPIPGTPPDLLKAPKGCPFVDRCTQAMKICRMMMPQETELSSTQSCSCWELHEYAREKREAVRNG